MSCRLNSKSEWRIREINSADTAFLAQKRNNQKEQPPARRLLPSRAGIRQKVG
jgi:hypothetical protein